MKGAVIFSKKVVPVSPKFEEFGSWTTKFAKDNQILSFLKSNNLQKEFYREFVSSETPIFLILGSIILDEIVKNDHEDTVNLITKAFAYIFKKQLIPNLKSSAEFNFLELVALVRTERKSLQAKREARDLFEEIYKKTVDVSTFLSALAEASRVLTLQKLLNDENTRSSGDLISAIVNEKSLAKYSHTILSNFASVLPYEIKLIQIYKENEMNLSYKTFGRSTGTRFSASLLVMRLEKSNFSFLCYNSSDLTLGYVQDGKENLARNMISRKQETLISLDSSEIYSQIKGNKQLTDKKTDITTEIIKQPQPQNYLEKTTNSSDYKIQPNERPYLDCTLCHFPTIQDSSLIYESCGHVACLDCLQKYSSKGVDIDKGCILSNCEKELKNKTEEKLLKERAPSLNNSGLSKSASRIQILSVSSTKKEEANDIVGQLCNNCKKTKDPSKCFKFPSCTHSICQDCKPTTNSIECPICKPKTNAPAMEKTSVTTKLSKSCINCGYLNEILQKQGDRLRCFKCSQCNTATCLIHNTLLNNCICYCPNCLSGVKIDIKNNTKRCLKCSFSLCLECRKEYDKNSVCRCSCAICFNKVPEGDNICVQCREDPTVCFLCYDSLSEDSQVVFICGHKMCRVCKIKNYEFTDLSQVDCKICELLAAEMYLTSSNFS